METSPTYNYDHPFLLDQYFSLPSLITETATIGFSDEFHQPYNQVLPITSFEQNVGGTQASIGITNNFQSSDSSMPMGTHDHKFKDTMPTTNSSFNDAHTNDQAKDTCKRRKKQKKSNVEKDTKKKSDSQQEGQKGYIHVRARRGEATDSHSLAERARREKISEKMRTLQAIVPGCDQITGKALMLDQVINYVQTLQNEVQILSLELASVNNPILNGYGGDFEEFIPKYHQSMTTHEQQMPCMISQNNGEALWDFEEQKQELIDPFADMNFNSYY